MNDTAAELGNQTNSIFSNTSPGVIVVLALVALLAAVTIAGLVYGAHQKRRRKHAEAEVTEHAEEEREATGDRSQTAERPAEDDDAPPPAPDAGAAPAPSPSPTPPPASPLPPPPAEYTTPDEPAASARLADEPIPATDAATANPAGEAEAGAEDAANANMADAPVTVLKGLGPKVAAQLNELGIATVGDLAALDERAAQDLDARLGAFTGRMARDRWLEQARLLAAGDRKGFEERFGKLER